jgi:Cd2+/Zn2+-exporting ATPase
VHDHGHGDSCCSGTPAPTLVNWAKRPAGSRLSTFRIEAMDCPTEQTLIQNKLGKLAGVQQLEFNLINRVLASPTTCRTPRRSSRPSNPRDAGRPCEGHPGAELPAKKHWWPLALSGVGALAAEVCTSPTPRRPGWSPWWRWCRSSAAA